MDEQTFLLLLGGFDPEVVSAKAVESLQRAYSISLLNSFTASRKPAEVYDLLAELADTPIDPCLVKLLRSEFAAKKADRKPSAVHAGPEPRSPVVVSPEVSRGPTEQRTATQAQTIGAHPNPESIPSEPSNGPNRLAEVAPVLPDERAQAALAEPEVPDLRPFERWVRELVFPGRPVTDISPLLQSLAAGVGVGRPVRVDELLALKADALKLRDWVGNLLHDWPSDEMVKKVRADAQELYDRAKLRFGTHDADALLATNPCITLGELQEILDIVETVSLDDFPTWLWGGATSPIAQLQALLDEATRSAATTIAAAYSFRPGLPCDLLRRLPPCPANVSLDHHVEAWFKWFDDIPQPLRVLLDGLTDAAGNGERIAAFLGSLRDLQARLRATVYDAVVAEAANCTDFDDCLVLLKTYQEAAREIEHLLGAISIDFEQLRHFVGKRVATPPAGPVAGTTVEPPHDWRIEHDWTGASGSVAFVAFRDEEGRPYSIISVPLAIHQGSRTPLRARLRVDLRSKHRLAWPSEWPDPTPSFLHIPAEAWSATADGRGFLYPFRLDIPVRKPTTSESLELVAALLDDASGRGIGEERRLRWDGIAGGGFQLDLEWPEGINPDYVRQHPVGPQKRHQQLEVRIRNHASFAVIAPRRFGKSTLVTYLREFGRHEQLVVPDAVVCTRYVQGGTLDYARLWQDVSDRLQWELGSSIQHTSDGPLPAENGFDFVRSAAAAKGLKGILLLFDEAQLFFVRCGGYELGDRLKDSIEANWSQRRPVPVFFGLVGLPTLTRRAGGNLMGLLRPDEGSAMLEGDLNRLLLGVTKSRLQTTRLARLRLTRSAANLFILRTLVDSLVERLNAEGRPWANLTDVEEVEQELVRKLESGEAAAVGDFVRDALNDADSVNVWSPNPAFPAAAALALAESAGGKSAEARLSQAVSILNQWCSSAGLDSARVSYSQRQLAIQVERLAELGVYQDGRFRSRFMEAWLRGQVKRTFPENGKDALTKGALHMVRTPPGLRPLDEGGEASLSTFDQDGQRYVLRQVRLHTDEDRSRYLEALGAMRLLIDGINRGEEGARYVFDLREVGFMDGDDMTGAQVYRWIEGQDLQTKVGELPLALVAHIGHSLALALKLLERHGILHRDIAPKNVVLEHPSKTPILIDFGLARFRESSLRTALATPYSAPEVQHANPRWSPKADVFSLAATLQKLKSPQTRDAELEAVLASCLHEDPGKRPTASELAHQFSRICLRCSVAAEQDRASKRIAAATAADLRHSWFMNVVDKFVPAFQMIALGYHRHVVDVCAEMADFLNQVLEASPPRRGKRLSLGYVKAWNAETGTRFVNEATETLHRLRNSFSHGDGRLKARGLDPRWGHGQELTSHVHTVAGLVEAELGLRSVRSLIRFAMEGAGLVL